MQNSLNKNILATIVYYDVLDYPLTSFEVWKYLTQTSLPPTGPEKYDLFAVEKALEEDCIKKYISQKDGFYFLHGRESLVEARLERNKISQRKLRIMRRIASILRFVPFVRMVAVTGKVSQKNARSQSDLDFFIVLEKNKIFLGRALVTMAIQFLGKRRYGRKIADRACLNYYVTSSSLEIDLKDIYSSAEYTFIFPLFGKKIFHRFQKENTWLLNFKPNFYSDAVLNLGTLSEPSWIRVVQKFLEKIFSFEFFEKKMKKWQMKRIADDPRTYQKGSAVMAGDAALVFLPDPHGPKVYEKFREKLDQLRIV